MNWIDIACIVFVCVTSIHLGLVGRITEVLKLDLRKFEILTCPKCLTWWCTMFYGFTEFTVAEQIAFCIFVKVLAISFLASYSAIWLELFEGYVDTLYMKLYEKIYPNSDNDTPAADADSSHSAGTVS